MYRMRIAVFIAAFLWTSGATTLRHANPSTGSDPNCPYGYGDGCENFWDATPTKESSSGKLDAATKAKVADILGGIIKNLSSKPVAKLVGISQHVVRSTDSLAETNSASAVLGSLVSALQKRTAADAARLCASLAGETVDARMATAVTGALADTVASNGDICPFGFGCGGGGEIDPATKAKVAAILGGMIKRLSSGQRQLPLHGAPLEVRRALGSLLATLQSAHASSATAVVEQLIGKKIDAAPLSSALLEVVKFSDPCLEFGYGCSGGGGGGPISSATKAQVANILKGMIRNLSGHR